MSRPPTRPIKRLLVANRGEIATRIIACARELGIETFAIYVVDDDSHTLGAAHAIKLDNASVFMSIKDLLQVVKTHHIDAVHPGYGFLSESEEFSKRLWNEANTVVIGPGWDILAKTGDKLQAKSLAAQCQVPSSPALDQPTDSLGNIQKFAAKAGYPLMVKAVDGGGGRGIRLVRKQEQLESSFKRALEESPSRQVFAERAAVDDFHHIEVQIIGDGTGNVTHLWERECSIQRRYQKVVEYAPSLISDRRLIAQVVNAALKIASHVRYFSLGTFEFLVNPRTKEYYFLEVNPRLQVEHTITESIATTDLVRCQLLLSQGATLDVCSLTRISREPETLPPLHSIQLRITAENVENNWSLSIGKVTRFRFPTGNGIRVDTHLVNGHATTVSTDFDSLVAKLVITGSSWHETVRKAQRALEDTSISGVQTNIGMLKAIVAHRDFLEGDCDTRWLEDNQTELLEASRQYFTTHKSLIPDSTLSMVNSTASAILRKGDAWSAMISSPTSKGESDAPCHVKLTRVFRNDFPGHLSAELLFSTPSQEPIPYKITLSSTSATAAATTSQQRRGDPSNSSHIIVPFPGKLMEVLVQEGDVVKQDDVVCVIQQMKMELEVRSPRSGVVTWITESDDGEDVAEGMLAAIITPQKGTKL
ncbi:hypothetical protein AUEXF2481DRAFT_70837 [Aureobasidium subglaciale EXF-2481]|uniref:Uncharacterized protein n=1 Tax=Aureobasidium subglaciale (strain EXF-2481) TaxID=1043005 RepID=A0A074XZB0_AURSE|nr:uncharacterized protein AUEXF2481DRAFT_70837 [Aureobasidium subglaciale EXF-2481]KEQ90785.1 hypothetical protein AUEXF2481DRAFT_70837 [Aureobasidium subglaciale EXF-2481]